MKSDRAFFLLMSLWFMALAVSGFSPTFKNTIEDHSVPTYVKVHGFVFVIWLLLFFLQTVLIRLKKANIHILLGKISVLAAIAIVVSGFWVAFQAAPDNGGRMLGQQIKIISLFACFFTLGMAFRKMPDQHKRYMAFATINIMSPAIFRIKLWGINEHPPFIFAIIFIPTIAIVVYDLVTTKQLNKATIVGVSLILGVGLVTGLFYKTAIWASFVEGVISGF